MNLDFDTLLVVAAYAIPIIVIVITVFLGVRQVRSLRDLTGDHSILTTILGFTIRPPSQPDPDHLRVHPRVTVLRRRRSVKA